MKSKLFMVIAVLMAAATIACVGAGCAGNGNGQESTASSAASSKDESKSESPEESKIASAEDSKSKEESKTESFQDSKPESAEEGKSDTSEECLKTSDASSDEGSNDYSGYSAFLGSWEHAVADEYYAFELYENGTGKYRFKSGSDIDLRWNVEDGKLCLRAAGGLETFEYVDGKLKDTEYPREYVKVDTLYVDTKTDTSDYSEYTEFFGKWEYSIGGTYYAFELYDNGTGKYRFASGSDIDLRWRVEDGLLCLRAAGGLETFEYVDGKLKDTEYPREYFKVDTLSIDS